MIFILLLVSRWLWKSVILWSGLGSFLFSKNVPFASSFAKALKHRKIPPRHNISNVLMVQCWFDLALSIQSFYDTYLILGESSDWKLVKSETFDDPFEKGNTDVFTFNGKIDLGELFVCRIEHDNSGLKSGWHLEHINVIQGDKNWLFPCNQVHKYTRNGSFTDILVARKNRRR